jgi:hypothetical protein
VKTGALAAAVLIGAAAVVAVAPPAQACEPWNCPNISPDPGPGPSWYGPGWWINGYWYDAGWYDGHYWCGGYWNGTWC